jgi:hypothetical protein
MISDDCMLNNKLDESNGLYADLLDLKNLLDRQK